MILKYKPQIKELFESNASESMYQVHKRNRKSDYADVSETLYQWYQAVVKKNVYPDGRFLAEKA